MVQNEVLSITLLHLLETLTPLQRAVFLLRQVFDYDYAEIAHVVQKSTVHCRQLMWQARHALSVNRQHDSAKVKQYSLIVHQFLDAYERGDMESLLSLNVTSRRFVGSLTLCRTLAYASRDVETFLCSTDTGDMPESGIS